MCLLKFLVASSLTVFVLASNDNNIIFKNVDRVVDISSQLVKITNTIVLENAGGADVKKLTWVPEEGNAGNLSYISARDATRRELKVVETLGEKVEWTINVPQIAPGKTATITIEEVYIGLLLPYPTAITQKERQLIRYFGSYYIYTPYLVKTQTTKVLVRSKTIENYSKLNPFTQNDNSIKYGPYNNIQPNTYERMFVHYENNSPFLTVTELKRYIEVSHWGNIAIEENIKLLHTGAQLKGSFSRYEYQKDTTGFNSVRSFKTLLPASAERLYYRDTNGNVSTSNLRVRKDSVELDIRPRFPLFGGWKTSYTLGYNVPSYQYLYHSGDNYILKIRLLDHVFDDMQVEDLETKIVLPVGATDIKLKTPYSINRLPDMLHFKYLDTKGRPVITFTKKNLVENHIQDFELQYRWHHVLMIHEPIMIIFALYFLFLCVIIYARLDFSITQKNLNKKQ